MPRKITDLSDLLADDKHVRFRKNGAVYTLPGDIPAELFLGIQMHSPKCRLMLQVEAHRVGDRGTLESA